MNYAIIKHIDSGIDADVFLGHKYINDVKMDDVAIKRYICNDNNFLNPNIFRELSVLKKAKFQHIVKFLDLYYDDAYVYIVLEFVDTNILNKIINVVSPSTDINTYKMLLQLVEAIHYLHSIGYIHGDINLKNVMYKHDENNLNLIKLIDFCSSTKIHRNHIVFKPAVYVCPYELLKHNSNNIYIISDMKALDIWMLGCVLFFIETKIPIIVSKDEEMHLRYIRENIGIEFDYNKRNDRDPKLISLIKNKYNFIKRMLRLQPQKRIKIYDVYKKLLQYDEKFDHNNNIIHTNDKLQLFFDKVSSHKESNTVSYVDKNNLLNALNSDKNKYIPIVTNLIEKLNEINNVHIQINIEALILAQINIQILAKKIDLTCEVDALKYFLICVWLSCKVTNKFSNNNILSLNSILIIFTNKTSPATHIKNLKNDVLKVCDLLNWDIDPVTTYDYIQYIPEKNIKMKYIYMILMFINVAMWNNISANELVKFIGAFFVMYSLMKMNTSKTMNEIINKIKISLVSKSIDKYQINSYLTNYVLSIDNFLEKKLDHIVDKLKILLSNQMTREPMYESIKIYEIIENLHSINSYDLLSSIKPFVDELFTK